MRPPRTREIESILLQKLLPEMGEDGIHIAVFPTLSGNAAVCTPGTVIAALREELEKYGG